MAYAQNNQTDGGAEDIAAIEAADADGQRQYEQDAEYRKQRILRQLAIIADLVSSMRNAITGEFKPTGSFLHAHMVQQTPGTLGGVGHLETAVQVLRELTDMAKRIEGTEV